MRGTRAKQLRRQNPAPDRPGPDLNPGLGRALLRQNRRENRKAAVRTACAAIIVGIDPADRDLRRILLDDRYDWMREISTRRLLGHVHRIQNDRARRAA